MPNDRLMKLIDDMQDLSSSYAHVTTELSNQIVTFEKRLTALDGKVEAKFKQKDGWWLSFERKAGSWILLVGNSELQSWRLSAAPVSAKILGVKMLERLLLKMRKTQNLRYTEAMEAQAIIGPLLGFLPTGNKKEGQ